MSFVATAVPAEAKQFYAEVLGLTLVADGTHALVFDCRGTQLRVQKVETLTPAPYTVLGWKVDDIESAVDDLVGRGVAFQQYGFAGQDRRGIWTVPGSDARVAWFTDPDGNILSLQSGE